jgi:putative sterol carrier protein
MSNASDISTPKQLAAMVEGRSDADIIAAVNEIGVDAALDKVFEGMKAQFLPKKAAGQTATIQWDVQANGKSHLYQVIVTNGDIAIKAGNSQPSRVTLTLQLPDFLRLVTGKLNGQQAFFAGKLKLAGDMMFAMTQQGWFDMSFAG